jgi:hypothetical protein
MRALLAVALLTLSIPAIAQSMSDAQVRQAIIQAFLVGYSGSCPCPYSVNRGGRRCGGTSAYSRPGGASPICYGTDVTKAMIQAFRASMSR